MDITKKAQKVLKRESLVSKVFRLILEAPTTVYDITYELNVNNKKAKETIRSLSEYGFLYVWGTGIVDTNTNLVSYYHIYDVKPEIKRALQY